MNHQTKFPILFLVIMRYLKIQFPIYEFLKSYWTEHLRGGVPVNPLQAAACGSFGGAIAAAATTPLDVVKTRLMLGADKDGKLYKGALDVVQRSEFLSEQEPLNIQLLHVVCRRLHSICLFLPSH